MKLFMVQDKWSGLWWKKGTRQGTFVAQKYATIFILREGANQAVLMLETWAKQHGYYAFGPAVREFDPFEALSILHDMYDVIDSEALAPHIANVKYTAWQQACARARRLL